MQLWLCSTKRGPISHPNLQLSAEHNSCGVLHSVWRPIRQRRACRTGAAQAAEPPSDQEPNAVEAAMAKAREAMQAAESNLDRIEELPSARLREPRVWLRRAGKALAYMLGMAGIYVSHMLGWRWQAAGGLLAASAVSLSGLRKGSLSPSGAAAAVLVGTACIASSLRLGFTLLAFFGASSQLTRYKEHLKDVDEHFKPGGQRDWRQVCCNGLVPAGLALLYAGLTRGADVPLRGAAWRSTTAALGAYLGHMACCCGDTWASELGQLSSDTPRLATTLRPVRKGTNGGVTRAGLLASLAGGAFIGLVFWSVAAVSPTLYTVPALQEPAIEQWSLVLLGAAAGLVGSLIDSLLGATVQFTGYNLKTEKLTSKPGPDVVALAGSPLLTNNGVNIVSASLTGLLTGLAVLKLYAV